MAHMSPEEAKDLLRAVVCPGRSRNIVSLGFVKSIAVRDRSIIVEFNPDIQNVEKILQMEDRIRDVLRAAQFEDIVIESEPPYDDTSMMLGGPSMNPLQVDFGEYGIDPNPDLIEGPGARARNLVSPEAPKGDNPVAEGAGVNEFAAAAADGPQGALDPGYDGPLPVFQWQIDPEAADAAPVKVRISIDSWNFVVCWLRQPTQNLVYASLQARHWIYHDGKARPNPAGRTEAVNLVHDEARGGVVAVYGTVKDFRPFIEAFRRACVEGEGVREDVAPERRTAPAATVSA